MDAIKRLSAKGTEVYPAIWVSFVEPMGWGYAQAQHISQEQNNNLGR